MKDSKYRFTVVVDEPLLALLKYHACRKEEAEGLCDSLSTTAYKILWTKLRKTYPTEARKLRKQFGQRRFYGSPRRKKVVDKPKTKPKTKSKTKSKTK